jgi:hypothetical protein
MKLKSLTVILLAFLYLSLLPIHIYAQEVKGLKRYMWIPPVGTYLKFQKPIDAIDGSYREKGYN